VAVTSRLRARLGASVVGLGLLTGAAAQTVAPGIQGSGAPENTGPNNSIVERSSGSEITRGSREDWQLLKHPDGSTTAIVWKLHGKSGVHTDAIFRLGPDRKPLVSWVWTQAPRQPAQSEFIRDGWPVAGQDLLTTGKLRGASIAQTAANAPGRLVSRKGVVRWAHGHYAYTTIKDGRARGTEDFHLTVHADGSRSLTMWHDIFARHSQFTVNLQIDARQRPTDAFISYWTAAGYKGSTYIKVAGTQLLADYRGPAGDRKQALLAPANFSIGSHPVAGDGWHTFDCDVTDGQSGAATVYSMEATADLSKPMLGQLTDVPRQALGAERITVPGGSFDTLHYRLGGVSDIWITQQDRLMVKFITEKFDRVYTLVEFYGEGFTHNQERK
jgi:hypothetical protein